MRILPRVNVPLADGVENSSKKLLISGIDVSFIKTHFYPEGGWRWLVCAVGFLAPLLTTGMQLAFGLLHLYAIRHLGELHVMDIGKL